MLRRAMMAGGGSPPPPSGWNTAVAALPGLWGWWKLDETAGASVAAADASGNGRDGAYNASGTQSTGLFAGSVASQSSLGGGISIPNFNFSAGKKFTVGTIIQTTHAVAAEQQMFSSDSGGGQRAWQFYKHTSTQTAGVTFISPSVVVVTGATPISDGNPHLVIFTFDESLSAGDGRIKIYVDGALDGASTTAVTNSASNNGPSIGSRGSGGQGLWAGAIDDSFLCLDAISASDVAALWAARNS